MKKYKIVKLWDDLPLSVRKKVDNALTEDILQQYDNESYHNPDIIWDVLETEGYKMDNDYLSK